MRKLSERVRELYDDMNEARVAQTCNEAADVLNACERALEGVIAVADRKTVEFDLARAVLEKLRSAK